MTSTDPVALHAISDLACGCCPLNFVAHSFRAQHATNSNVMLATEEVVSLLT